MTRVWVLFQTSFLHYAAPPCTPSQDVLMGVAVPPVVEHTHGTWRLLYFDVPNRGEQVRQLFAISKTPFVDVRLQYPKGLVPYKKLAMVRGR